MQRTNVLTIEYKNQSIRFKNPRISEVNGELYIWDDNIENFDPVYNAFDYPELISELVTMVKKSKNGRDKNKLAKTWVKKWGVLRRGQIKENIFGQRLDLFWRQAETFELLWSVYKYIANRDEFWLSKIDYIEEEMKCLSEDPIINNQLNGIMIITNVIEVQLKNGFIQSSQIKRIEDKDGDIFKIKPVFYLHQLLDAIYMQFYLALTENQKVCPVCDSPFTPGRHDQIYDRESCKRTAKSRRYRESKKHSIL